LKSIESPPLHTVFKIRAWEYLGWDAERLPGAIGAGYISSVRLARDGRRGRRGTVLLSSFLLLLYINNYLFSIFTNEFVFGVYQSSQKQ